MSTGLKTGSGDRERNGEKRRGKETWEENEGMGSGEVKGGEKREVEIRGEGRRKARKELGREEKGKERIEKNHGS